MRDVVFWWKYVQCPDWEVFPDLSDYQYQSAHLQWELAGQHNTYYNQSSEQCFTVEAFDCSLMPRKHSYNHHNNLAPEPTLSGARWGSDASPNDHRLGLDRHVESEADVLHIPKLPTFDGTLGQADAELLISFLTVPYLRMPYCHSSSNSNGNSNNKSNCTPRACRPAGVLPPNKLPPYGK